MKSHIKKLLFALTLLGYVTITVFGFIHIAHMAEMNMPMENCPFAVGEHSLCQMSVTEHIRAWEQFSRVLIPSFKVLTLASALFILFSFAYFSPPITRFLLYLRRERLRIFSLYQQLFSRGILNPKVP